MDSNDITSYLMHARVLVPPMFMLHEPQMPSLQLLLNVRLGSNWFLMTISASRTIGPQFPRSTWGAVTINQQYSSLH